MIKHYNDYVQDMVNLMAESGLGEYGRTSRKRWYEAFGRYLSEAGLVYSDENVSKWLDEVIKPANTRQQYHVTARYMEQLREFIRTGELQIENLPLVKPDHDKLPRRYGALSMNTLFPANRTTAQNPCVLQNCTRPTSFYGSAQRG